MHLVIIESEDRSRYYTLAFLCNASRTTLMFNEETGFVPGTSVSKAFVCTCLIPTSSSKAYEGAVRGSFLLSPPLRLPFGLRYTTNLHAVMTSCRKTANNKSERPSYETICVCGYVYRCCNERHSCPTGMHYPVHPVVRCNFCDATSRAICPEKSKTRNRSIGTFAKRCHRKKNKH